LQWKNFLESERIGLQVGFLSWWLPFKKTVTNASLSHGGCQRLAYTVRLVRDWKR
jgi:hypothetical protein